MYISLAAHNSELIVIEDMSAFTTHFCYAKKQNHGLIEPIKPQEEPVEEGEMPIPSPEIEQQDSDEEDEL